jgi:ribosomal protein L35AE/L33A
VKTGKEAVERYAMPDPTPACYVFTGKPKKDTKIQRGTVEPAHGRTGGGVEVYFEDGTQPNTVTGPDVIPEG